MTQGQKMEFHVVKVSDIVEFPTKLGNRCLLLPKLGFNAYWNTEEEILDTLIESAKYPEMLSVCIDYSPCRRFWEEFRCGHTPFKEREPIQLLKYGNRHWVIEGKHRVCLAKRAGVENMEVLVYPLKEDTMSLLPPEGKPGQFSFSYSVANRKFQGTLAYLQVYVQQGLELKFGLAGFRSVWLDAGRTTEGQFDEILPGVRYWVSVRKQRKRLSLFHFQEEIIVESKVLITPDHPKTKVWLLDIPAAEVFGFNSSSFRTIYRWGCWRQGHLLWLSRMLPYCC